MVWCKQEGAVAGFPNLIQDRTAHLVMAAVVLVVGTASLLHRGGAGYAVLENPEGCHSP